MHQARVLSFVDVPPNRHGNAKVSTERKLVFLPGAHMKAVENGKLREFRDGEEKKYPTQGSVVLLKYQAVRGGALATEWGVLQ